VKIRCIVFLLILLCLTSAVPIRAATPGPSTSAGADALAVDVYGNEYSDSIFYQNSKHPIAFHGAVVFAVVSSAYFLLRLRKRKKELAEVNDRLDRYNRLIQTFLNADSGYVFLKDSRLNYVIVNEAMRKALRRPRDQIIGRGDFELMPQSLSKISTMADAEVLMNQAELTETVQWRNRYFRSTKFPVGMPDGSTGVGAYISDVTDERTEQMRHERELAWHKRMMEMLTGTFPDRHQQLEYALQIARELSESEHGCLAFYEEETEVYTAEIFSVSEQDSVAAIDESKIKRLFKEVRDKAVADKQPVMDNRFSDTDPCDGQHFIHNLLCVPIIVAGQAVAVVGLCNKGSDYDEVDVSELTMFMTSVWNAVKRRKHMTMLAQERDRFFKTIMSIGDAVIVVSRDGRIQMINDMGIQVMETGKDYFTDKTPLISLEQLDAAKAAVAKTGKKYMVYYSERLHVESAMYAGELVHGGAIGKVLQVIGLGPHRLNAPSRPDWFFKRKQYGGILCDIGSHQIEQFLYFTGATDATIQYARAGNMGHPEYRELEDFGECALIGNNGAGNYFRVDWFTPDGLSTWGDGRMMILGTKGYIELRKYLNVATEKEGDHVFLVTDQGEQHLKVHGQVGFPFFGQLILDSLNRTENAMTQAHAFKAAELCVRAQMVADSASLPGIPPVCAPAPDIELNF